MIRDVWEFYRGCLSGMAREGTEAPLSEPFYGTGTSRIKHPVVLVGREQTTLDASLTPVPDPRERSATPDLSGPLSRALPTVSLRVEGRDRFDRFARSPTPV